MEIQDISGFTPPVSPYGISGDCHGVFKWE